jgi:hypothetical protein
MPLRSNQELQAKDNVLPLTDRMHNNRNKRAAVSSDTDGKQLAPVKKRRRVGKAVKKKEEMEDDLDQQDEDKPEDSMKPPPTVKKEEDFLVNIKEEIEDDLQLDKDDLEDSTKPPAVVKKEEADETEVLKEGIGDDLQLDEDEPEDSTKPPAVVKKEEEDETEVLKEGIGDDRQLDEDDLEDSTKPTPVVKEEEKDETEVKEDGDDDLQRDEDDPEECNQPPAVIKTEEEDDTEVKEDSEGDLQLDRDEPNDYKKSPAAVKKEEDDDQATYLPDESTSTKGLLLPGRPSDTDTTVKTASYPKMTVTNPKSVKPVAHAATPVPIVQANPAVAQNLADNKSAVPGRGNVCNENKALIRGYATGSRSNTNTVKRKYSLRSLSQKNNKKSARSNPLRKDKGSSTSLGEVNRSPMASSDEDEFGRGIESAVDDASDTSDSEDGIIDHDEAILNRVARWNKMYKMLRGYYETHGHCELFLAVDRFIFILNTAAHTPLVSHPECQVKCHKITVLTRNWAVGSANSVSSSKLTKWIWSERRSSTRLVSSSI